MHLEPAASVIAKFGAVREVAEITQVRVHTVVKWRLPRDKGGTGGHVPHWHHEALLKAAATRGIDLRAEDFVRRSEAA